jgi:putative ABC transport system substrate-binding protein
MPSLILIGDGNMRRREFITLLGGAVAAPALPLAAQAEQSMPVVGFLRSTPQAADAHLVAALRQGLKEAGLIEGKSVAIEFRWADSKPERLPGLVTELIRRPVGVIVGDNVSMIAAKAATSTVPIVFATGGDPVEQGLVASLNRPGGNVTGVSFFSGELGAKRLTLLRQVAPKATTIAVLMTSGTPTGKAEQEDVERAAKTLGQQLLILDATTDRDIDTAFATIVQRGAGALLVGAGAFLNSRRQKIAALAATHSLPAVYFQREAVFAGGLMSYGTNITEAYRQVGLYAARILKGEKPADLPVMQPTQFEFVLNLRTAKALGLDIPPTLLAIADEVIE